MFLISLFLRNSLEAHRSWKSIVRPFFFFFFQIRENSLLFWGITYVPSLGISDMRFFRTASFPVEFHHIEKCFSQGSRVQRLFVPEKENEALLVQKSMLNSDRHVKNPAVPGQPYDT